MRTRDPRNRKALPPLAAGGSLTREALPRPLVYYPSQAGAFFAFAATRDEAPVLCLCAQRAVRNLRRMSEDGASIDLELFPTAIVPELMGRTDPLSVLRFRPGLCHRCNRAAPTLRYCRELEGTSFVQTYGWYVNLTYLRLGIHPGSLRYLPEVCPPQFRGWLDRAAEVAAQAREVRAKLMAHWPSVPVAEQEALEALERELARPKRELRKAIENVTRAGLGFKAIGDAWVSETRLYDMVCDLFPEEEVLRHHRPEWLGGLELDIYLPGRQLAIEYQGQQHFQPVQHWGGEAALQLLQARDARKAQMCSEAGVSLVIVHYEEPLTEEHIRERIQAP